MFVFHSFIHSFVFFYFSYALWLSISACEIILVLLQHARNFSKAIKFSFWFHIYFGQLEKWIKWIPQQWNTLLIWASQTESQCVCAWAREKWMNDRKREIKRHRGIEQIKVDCAVWRSFRQVYGIQYGCVHVKFSAINDVKCTCMKSVKCKRCPNASKTKYTTNNGVESYVYLLFITKCVHYSAGFL